MRKISPQTLAATMPATATVHRQLVGAVSHRNCNNTNFSSLHQHLQRTASE